MQQLKKENDKELRDKLFLSDKNTKELEKKFQEEIKLLSEKNNLLEDKLRNLEYIISLMQNSRSWKFTQFARELGQKVRKIRSTLLLIPIAVNKKGGALNLVKLCTYKLKQGGVANLRYSINSFLDAHKQENIFTPKSINQNDDISFLFKVSKQPEKIFKTKVIIIAELSIPQCTKYRVTQKKELIESLNCLCEVVSWTDYFKAKDSLSLSSIAIFYRVPGHDSVLSLISEAKRLGIPTFWEVDDLIFDVDVLKDSRTINSLDKNTIDSLLDGARLYRKAMLACEETIASTPGLAKEMLAAGVKNAYVMENALDKQTLLVSKEILNKASTKLDDKIRIVYGSGTSTHNIDFEEAAPSLARILKENSNIIFRIIGILKLPNYFDGLEKQIERIEFCEYAEYLHYLSECDISIAPLEDYIFNESKSNIKYLEASIVKVASISSPLSAFTAVIENGKNGLIASNSKEWYEHFNQLVNDKKYREKLAEAAYNFVSKRYAPSSIARDLYTFLPKEQIKSKERLISFNVFYRPRSFGGATIVAEQINDLIADNNDYEVYVVTTLPQSSFMEAYSVMRYELNNTTIFGICIPNEDMDHYENKKVYSIVSEILDLVEPDLAHIHCIQGLGVGVLDACIQQNIKTVVTLHDAWWLCPRQFMIQSNGEFCNQHKIDKEKCMKCINSMSEYLYRSDRLLYSLNKVDVLLAPSQYFSGLYKANLGRDILCNKNGIKPVQTSLSKFKNNIIRFGYVGGRTPIKGFHLILDAFKKYQFENAELVVVDNLLNLGNRSYPESDFNGINKFEILPAYTQDNIDEFFNSIDVLLFPTQCKESFGLTVREATIRNVWVITTDAGGVVEDIIDGVNGTIIPFGSNYQQLANAIQSVINMYQNKNSNEEINLEKDHITTFESQKSELIQIFKF